MFIRQSIIESMGQTEFINIITKHQMIINNICHLYFSTSENRKDARQEIILQLWKSYPSFNHKCKWSTWIYRVALNTVFGLIRKNKSQRKLETSVLNEVQLLHEGAFNDDVEYLKHLINCLKELDKAIILLSLEGYSNKEISHITSLTMTNVSSRLCRIKQYLRKLHTTKYYEVR